MTAPANDKLAEINRAQVGSESDDFTEQRYHQFYSYFRASDVAVLDVGCNTGRGGSILKKSRPGLKIIGLDCVNERVLAANETAYDQCLEGFGDNVPLPDYSFDVIVGGEMIEHVPPTDVDKTLCEFFRLLKLKGRVLLTTPNPYYLKNKLKNLSVLTEKSHLTQHFPETLKARMKMVGFANMKIHGTGRMTRYIGTRFPFLPLYGSYLISGEKW